MILIDHLQKSHLLELVGNVPDHDCGALFLPTQDSEKVNVIIHLVTPALRALLVLF